MDAHAYGMLTHGITVNVGSIQRLERRPPPLSNNSESVHEVDNRGYSSIDYRLESARLASYEHWPAPYLDPAKMAAAGFFFTGDADRVQCFVCGVEIFEWIEGDNPASDHQRWRPICKFVRKLPCGNVPIGVDPDTVPIPTPRSRDINYGEDYRLSASPDFQFSNAPRLSSSSMADPKSIRHPEYTGHELELRTFHNSPKSEEQLTDDGRICKICYDRELGIVFLPCRHMVACVRCALDMDNCAVCREKVIMTVRAIIS